MKKWICSLVVPLLLLGYSTAQQLAIGQWDLHLPYTKTRHVTGNSSTVYAATENGLFKLNKADNSVDRISKIDGLSDLAIGAINYNPYNNVLVIGYAGGNVDILKGSRVVNISDIKRANIIGNKNINRVYFKNHLAYLATGFGIVVIDTDREEIKDTYIFGPNGNNIEVNDIVIDDSTIYAATGYGVYHANVNEPFLSYYANWSRYTGIPSGPYNRLALFSNKVFANFSKRLININDINQDTVYMYNPVLSDWDTMPGYAGVHSIYDLNVTNNRLHVVTTYNVWVYDPALNITEIFYETGPQGYIQPNAVYRDATHLWLADRDRGLIKMPNTYTGQAFAPNGPASNNSYSLTFSNGILVNTPGGKDDAWNNVFNIDGVSIHSQGMWSLYNRNNMPAIDTVYDILSAAIDPTNSAHMYWGSWGEGLVEIRNGAVTNIYDNNNSILQRKIEYQWVGIGGLQYDENGALWMTNSHVPKCLKRLNPNGTWNEYDFSGLVSNGTYVGPLMITSTGQKWMLLPRQGGLLVFDDKGTATTSDDKKKKLGFSQGLGNLPGTDVYCMVEDRDGEIWVGTDKGIGVFYCPENIFTTAGCDAQKVLINIGGYNQYLFENQVVTAIAIDGANRKWVGTEGGGVYLMSADGTQQLLHFTKNNSPLLSDVITAITIDPATGEVFIGTDKGLVSYKGDAIKGEDEMGDVYAYPNPVRPDHTGPIAIRGLVKDADVKITDIRGTVIYQTKALGGQAIWNGNNFNGERAATGVYMVFVTNDDGTQTAVTKILFVN
jgi:hypothetical protein